MRLGLPLVVATALALVSCTSESGLREQPASTSSTTVDEQADDDREAEPETGIDGGLDLVDPSPEQLQQVAELPGRIAVGRSNQLAVVDPDGTNLEWLDDAADVLAAQPVWSGDSSRLAWSRTSPDGHQLVTHDIDSGEQTVSGAPGTAAFYLQWSAGDEALAYLRNDAGGRGVEFGFAVPGSDAHPLIAAAPFFLAWSPTGSSLAAHVAGAQVIVLSEVLARPASEIGEPSIVLSPSGGFTTPAWLDDSTLLVSAEAGLSLLDINTQRSATLVASPEAVQFVVSPDRSKVAYLVPGLESETSRVGLTRSAGSVGSSGVALLRSEPAVPPAVLTQTDPIGGLAVLDLVTGDTTSVTGEAPLAWEWSPDSQRLAWLESSLSALRSETRWHFWDGESTTSAVPYRISGRELQTVLPFFEQYAQSHTRWSPDSTAFAFAGRAGSSDSDEADSVWIHLVGSDGPPIPVAEGDVAIWSN